MRIWKYIIIGIFCCHILSSQNIWELTHSGENEVSTKIEFPYSHTGFICISYQGYTTRLYKTIDTGKTWELRFAKESNTLYDMSCPDSSNIFLSFTKRRIMKSSDGGKSFDNIDLDTNDIYQVRHINMRNKLLGCASYPNILITRNGWKSYEKFDIDTNHTYIYSNPVFINDSIIYCVVQKYYYGYYLLKLNINTKDYEIHFIDKIDEGIQDLCVVNENLLFVCGQSNSISGGSCHDAIYKSVDGGKNWRRVLDMYYYNKLDTNSRNPFGLQQIAFKDSLTGIAVGQFGKIVYTYDGGESWIYESEIPESIDGTATMLVRYAGTKPIIGTFSGNFYRLIKDNIAPKPEDTLCISGRVWEGEKGQSGILIALGYRVIMTDSEGYYRFTRLKKGSYTVKVLSKHHDNPLSKDYYKPFDYSPLQYEINLTKDTSGFDFNAVDLRKFVEVSGYIINSDNTSLSDVKVTIQDSLAISNLDGKFTFNKIETKRAFSVIPQSNLYTFTPSSIEINLVSDTTDLKFVGSPVTSVEDTEIPKSIIISPNPASDYIEISIPDNANHTLQGVVKTGQVKVQIFNTLGIEVAQTPPSVISGQTRASDLLRIDISNLPTGVYFIKISDRVEKFVKM